MALNNRHELKGMGEALLLLTSRISHAGVHLPFTDRPTREATPATWSEWLRIIASNRKISRAVEGLKAARSMPLQKAVTHLLSKAEDILAHATLHLSESDWVDWLKMPLVSAASQGNFHTVSVLLRAGAGGRDRGVAAWMIPRGDGRTILHAAADSGEVSVVQALLDAGAGVVVNMVAGGGFSPFHVAAIQGSVPVAMALARAGAAVRRKAPYSESALHLAASIGNPAMASYLVVHLRLAVEGTDDMGATALHAAAWHGHVESVQALLELKAKVDSRDDCGMTPLFKAARGSGGGRAGFKVMELLLHAGAEVQASSEDGDTPLHVACRHGHAHAVRLLLRHDADENATCDVGKTPEVLTREGEKHGDLSPETAKEIYEALASGPAGRAWRRRGWLVMLRARAARASCDQALKRQGGKVATLMEETQKQTMEASIDEAFFDALDAGLLMLAQQDAQWENSETLFQAPSFGENVEGDMLDVAESRSDVMDDEWRAGRTELERMGYCRKRTATLEAEELFARDILEIGAFQNLVVRTLEMADGPFRIIGGYL